MPNTINSQYINMPVPVPTVDPGPTYATDLNSCLTLLDQHDHSPGKGTLVTPAGMNINQDLSFGSTGATTNYNATQLRSARFSVQSSPLSGVNDIGCVYVSGLDLYFNDRNSNQIRLTQSGTIAGSPGSIAGLVPPANVTYTGGNQTFTFQSSTATPANIDVGSVTIRNITANSAGITISPPANLTTNYTITASSGAPVSSSAVVTMNSAGNIGYATPAHITTWQSYNLVIHGTTTDPTYPAAPGPVVNKATWRQVGDSMEIAFTYLGNAGGGANGSGLYIFPLPSSTLIDSNKINIAAPSNNANNVGGLNSAAVCGASYYVSNGAGGCGTVHAFNSTGLVMMVYQNGASPTAPVIIGDAVGGLSATSAMYSFNATVPIVGWS